MFCLAPGNSKQKEANSFLSSKSPFYPVELVANLNQGPHEAVRFSSVEGIKCNLSDSM